MKQRGVSQCNLAGHLGASTKLAWAKSPVQLSEKDVSNCLYRELDVADEAEFLLDKPIRHNAALAESGKSKRNPIRFRWNILTRGVLLALANKTPNFNAQVCPEHPVILVAEVIDFDGNGGVMRKDRFLKRELGVPKCTHFPGEHLQDAVRFPWILAYESQPRIRDFNFKQIVKVFLFCYVFVAFSNCKTLFAGSI